MHTPSLQDLLAQADWVQGLAAAMAGDEATRSDLVQETWVAALEHERPVRDPRAWLRTVLQNLVRQRARTARRRTAREQRVARPEAVEGPATAVERAELHRRLVDRVLALPEPSRTLVLERYFEGMAPRALAQRHGVPLETLRTRLKRALAQLREVMERDERMDGGDWRALAVPLSSGASASLVGTVAGVLIMTTTTKCLVAAATLALLGFGTYGLWPREPAPPAAAGGLTSVGMAAASAGTERPAVMPLAAAPSADPPSRQLAAAARLEARLVGLHPTVAWTSTLAVSVRDGGRTAEQRVSPSPDGTFTLDLPSWAATAPFDVEVAADDPGYVPQAWKRARATSEDDTWQLTVVCAARLEGQVRGAAADAEVWVRAYPVVAAKLTSESIASTRCGPDGTFHLRLLAGEYLIVAASTDAQQMPVTSVLPASTRAAAVVGDARRVPALDLLVPVAVTGRLMLADGTPLTASLRASPVDADSLIWARTVLLRWPDDTVAIYFTGGRCDAAGRFEIGGLARKPHVLNVERVDGMFFLDSGRPLATVEPPADVDLRVDCAVLDVVIRADQPLVDASLEVHYRGGFRMPVPSGRVRLLMTIGRECRLQPRAEGMSGVETTWRAEHAGQHTLELRLLPGTPRSLVVRNVGDDVGDEHVRLFLTPTVSGVHPANFAPFTRLENGLLRSTEVSAGPHRLSIGYVRYADRRSFLMMEPRDVIIPETGEAQVDIEIRHGGSIRLVANPTGRLLSGRWRLLDAEGRELETSLEAVHLTMRMQMGGGELPKASTAETVQNLAPGRYRVEVDIDGQPRRTLDVDVVAGRTVDVLVPME